MEWKTITITYLELPPGQKSLEVPSLIEGLRIEKLQIPCPLFNCFMYRATGGRWFWVDKLNWSEEEWNHYVRREKLQTWGAWLHGAPCGYFELEEMESGRTEIAYFGILEQFSGQGLGRRLLIEALRVARKAGLQQRITVNTCSLDHPGALANYLARGMKIIRSETIRKQLPQTPPLFWGR